MPASGKRFLVDLLIALLFLLSIAIFAWHVHRKPLRDAALRGGLEYQEPAYVRLRVRLDDLWNDDELRRLIVPGDELRINSMPIGRITGVDGLNLTITVLRDFVQDRSGYLAPGAPVWINTDRFVLSGTVVAIFRENGGPTGIVP